MAIENDNKKQPEQKPSTRKEEKSRPLFESDDRIQSNVDTTGSTGPRKPSKNNG